LVLIVNPDSVPFKQVNMKFNLSYLNLVTLLVFSLLVFPFNSNANGNPELEANRFIDVAVQELQPHLKFIDKKHPDVFQVFAHGKSGKLFIDGEWIDGVEIMFWLKEVMPKNIKHVNIYGCNFAKGERGESALFYLEWMLDVTVAASNDVTGRDGDWDLEIGNPIGAIRLPEYSNNLCLDCQ